MFDRAVNECELMNECFIHEKKNKQTNKKTRKRLLVNFVWGNFPPPPPKSYGKNPDMGTFMNWFVNTFVDFSTQL